MLAPSRSLACLRRPFALFSRHTSSFSAAASQPQPQLQHHRKQRQFHGHSQGQNGSLLKWQPPHLRPFQEVPGHARFFSAQPAVASAGETNGANEESAVDAGEAASASGNSSRLEARMQKNRGKRRRAPITVTPSAARRIQYLLSKHEGPTPPRGVKIGVRRRGCNGMSYTMNYAGPEDIHALDEVVEQDGVTVIVDHKGLLQLLGMTMDFHEDDISAEFTFVNPNAKGSCGCGESFNI